MLSAYVLIEAEVGRAQQVLETIRGIDGVQHADGIAGPFDVIALFEAKDVDDLGRRLTRDLHAVQGVTRTLTCTVIHR